VPYRSTSTAGTFYIFDTGNSTANDFAVNGTVCELPSCSITGPDDFVCSNSSGIIYSAPAGMASYNWSISGDGSIPGATNGQSVSVTSGNFLGSYTVAVTITNANGCSSTCSKQSDIFFPTPPADITVNPNPACFGATLDLSIASASSSTVSWTGEGITNSNGTFSPGDPFSIWDFINSTTATPTSTGPHTYSVTVTSSAAYGGCSNTGEVMVTVNPVPPAPSCPPNSASCVGVSAFALSGGSPGGGTYSGPGVSGNMFDPSAAGPGTHTLTYTVTDGACSSSCTFTINVASSCTIDFSGKVIFSNNNTLGVNNATVTLAGSANGSDPTDANGDFYISTAISSGSFTLTPAKTTNKLNGVTSADATAIQQHVANSVFITDLYKQVAADVNKSNSINTLDASIITQSLLGNPSALAQFKTSWRFVPTSHAMTNPPWNFPEKRTYTNINSPQSGQDFYGIKTGDVVTTFANPANLGGKTAPFTVTIKNETLSANSELDIEFKADQFADLAALQFALRFDPAQLQFIEIQPGTATPLTVDNFGLYNISEGEIRMAWAQATGIAVSEAAPIFHLKFKALQSGSKLSEALQLDELELPALAYTGTLKESKVELKFSEATNTGNPAGASALQLLQNRPNPFNGTTTIGFVLPESCEAQLRIFDVSGKMLAERKAQYPAGKQEETFELGDVTGVLCYELTTPFGTLTKKMVAAK